MPEQCIFYLNLKAKSHWFDQVRIFYWFVCQPFQKKIVKAYLGTKVVFLHGPPENRVSYLPLKLISSHLETRNTGLETTAVSNPGICFSAFNSGTAILEVGRNQLLEHYVGIFNGWNFG